MKEKICLSLIILSSLCSLCLFGSNSPIRRLTTDGRVKADPTFVRGGSEIVYTVLESAVQMSLVRLRLTDGSTERLHPDAIASEFEATFTPDGRAYAFVQSRGNLNLKL